jgi:hypothetical protein
MLRILATSILLVLAASVVAAPHEETNKQVSYFNPQGLDAKDNTAAFKLDNPATPTGTCLWDVLIIDLSNAKGKEYSQKIQASMKPHKAIAKIVFTVNADTQECTVSEIQF